MSSINNGKNGHGNHSIDSLKTVSFSDKKKIVKIRKVRLSGYSWYEECKDSNKEVLTEVLINTNSNNPKVSFRITN